MLRTTAPVLCGLRQKPGFPTPRLSDTRTPAASTSAAHVARRAAPSRTRLAAIDGQRAWTSLRVLLDVLALVAAARLAVATAPTGSDGTVVPVAFVVLALGTLAGQGFYRRRLRVRVLDGVAPLVAGLSVAAMGSVLVAALADRLGGAELHLRLWAFAVLLIGVERIAMVAVHHRLRTRGALAERTLVVGAGEVGARIAARMADQPAYGLRPVGFLDAAPPEERPITGLEIFGDPSELSTIAPLLGVRHVVIAFSAEPDRVLLAAIRDARSLGLRVSLVPRFFDAVNDRYAYEAVGGLPLLGLEATDPSDVRFRVKHAIDRVVALLALAVLSPLLAAIALAVKLSSPGPVLFHQRRVGRDGRAFELLKFRSMAPATTSAVTPDETWLGVAPGGVEGDDRRTGVGRLLRRLSLDELPQLLNVLRGEMSLVGPRPERPDYVELFEQGVARYSERHRVKGGMTGWAQVHGLRGQTSLAERVELDNWYIEHWSLALDLKVLLMTALAVLRGAE